MTTPWLRRVELTIGSIPDWKADPTFTGPPDPTAIRILSDGTQNNLRIRFTVHKHIVSTSSPTTISIYNLSSSLRAALLAASGTKEMRGAQVILKVGWDNGDSGGLNTQLQPIFAGGLWAAWTRREGADLVTTLSCLAELPAYREVIQKTVEPRYSLLAVVLELARKIPGITVDPALVVIPTVISTGNRGMVMSGVVKDCLDSLSRVYGFSWHLIDGVFEACMDGDDQAFMGTVTKVSASNGFLLNAEPMLVSPWQQQAGISIRTLLHPLVNPGRVVELESGLQPRLNGSYLAQTVTHNGDTFSSSWTTDIESFFITRFPDAKVGVHSVDDAGLVFISKLEGGVMLHWGLVDNIPHIGVGHKLEGKEWTTKKIVINGQTVDYTNGITQQQAKDLMKQDIKRFENIVNSSIQQPLNQNQFNSLASISYNSGELATTELAKTINSGNFAKAGQDMLNFRITSQGTGQVSTTLINRRAEEAALWNKING